MGRLGEAMCRTTVVDGRTRNWGVQSRSKILRPALRGMKFKAVGGNDVGEMARRGEQAHS